MMQQAMTLLDGADRQRVSHSKIRFVTRIRGRNATAEERARKQFHIVGPRGIGD